MIDPIWAGVVGGAVGGGFTTLATILGAQNERRGRLEELEKTRDIAEDQARREYRQRLVADWRVGLADAAKARIAYGQLPVDTRPDFEPDIVGQEWFESLRPRLDRSSERMEFVLDSMFLEYDHATAIALSKEISRIEREWGLI